MIASLWTLMAVVVPSAGAASASTGEAAAPRIVVIGIPDLVWADVTATGTPALWRMVERGSAGALSVRAAVSRTCPADGWLTLGAGNRAAIGPAVEDEATPCLPPAGVTVVAQAGGGAVVPGVADARRVNERLPFDSEVGQLGSTLASSGGCVSAVGPGAALGAADSTGAVTAYAAYGEVLPSGFFQRCAVTLMAVDDLAAADEQVALVVAGAGSDTTVLVVGLSEVGSAPARLHVALATGPAPGGATYQSGYLTGSPQTSPYVQLIDVTPTILGLLGIKQPAAVVGQPWRPIPVRDSAAERADRVTDIAVAAEAQGRLVQPYFTLLVVLQILLYALAPLVIRRNPTASPRHRIRSVMAGAALAVASVPVATFLANLVPWWRADHPLLAVAAAVVAFNAAIVCAATSGPWRRNLLGPATCVAALTALVLAADVMSGSHLQMFSLGGYSAIVAGRFYGLGNVAFALFATGVLLAATGIANRYAERKRLAAAVVVLIGLAAVVVDGAPFWGADFGGVLALAPGVAVLGLSAAGKRVTVARVGLAVAAGAILVSAFAAADYLRPAAERTHLGRFVGQVLDGGALTVIERKASANLGLLTSTPLALIVPVALAFLALVLLRPTSTGAGALARAFEHAPLLRPGLVAVLTSAAVGFVVNDSGVVVPAMAMTLAVPLALAVSLRAVEDDPVIHR